MTRCTTFGSLSANNTTITISQLGAVHKVRHAREGGVREGVTVCDRGVKSMRRQAYTLLYHTCET